MVMQFENSVFAANSKIRQIFDECKNYDSQEEEIVKRKDRKRKRDDKFSNIKNECASDEENRENINENAEGRNLINKGRNKNIDEYKRKRLNSAEDEINVKGSPITGHTMISSWNEENENCNIKLELVKPKRAKAENMPISVNEANLETKNGELITIWKVEDNIKNLEKLFLKLKESDN